MTTPSTCPSCGATVRPDSPWCTLCYADLRPAPEPVAVVEPEPEPVAAPVAEPGPPQLTPTPVQRTEPPTWPCTACGTSNSFDRDTCAKCGLGFLAAAKDTGPLLELPVVGDITRLGRGQRLALVSGVVLLFIVLTLVIGVVLG